MTEPETKELTKEERRKQEIEGAIVKYVVDKYLVYKPSSHLEPPNYPKVTIDWLYDAWNDIHTYIVGDKIITTRSIEKREISEDLEAYWDYADRCRTRRDWFEKFGGIDAVELERIALQKSREYLSRGLEPQEIFKFVKDVIIKWEHQKMDMPHLLIDKTPVKS